jgi:hypothetical protein
MQIVTHVLTSPQNLDDARKTTARQNIGAVAGAKVGETPVSTDSDGFIVLPDASLQGKGIVKLVDSIDTEERFVAVTPKAVQDAMAQVGGYKVVDAGSDGKPNVPLEDRSPNYIYLTEDPDAQGEDHYNEWIWDLGDPSADPPVAASWKLIGTTSPDLRDYVHKVSGGTSGNVATLTNDGSIEDSRIAGTDVADAVAKKHNHSNKATLDDITAAYTTEEQTKLTGIAEGAQVNTIESISANGTALSPDDHKNVDIPLATSEVDGLLPHEKFPLIPAAPDAGADRIYSFDDTNGTSWQTIVKDYVGNMILDQQGNPVTDEKGEIMYEEEAVPLWLSYKGVEFGARRAYDDHTGANIHDSIASRTTMAQVTTAIETALANYGGFVVVQLTQGADPVPDVQNPSTKLIYLTKDASSTKTDPYTEWIYTADNHWEVIGETSIDLSGKQDALSGMPGMAANKYLQTDANQNIVWGNLPAEKDEVAIYTYGQAATNIYNDYNQEKVIYCKYNYKLVPLIAMGSNCCTFVGVINDESTINYSGPRFVSISLTGTTTWSVEYFKIPTPSSIDVNKVLTIDSNGAPQWQIPSTVQSVTYDENNERLSIVIA